MTTTTTPQLALTRIFDAPRALVYQAFTDPDHLAAWWGPIGNSLPRDEIEFDGAPRRLSAMDGGLCSRTRHSGPRPHRPHGRRGRRAARWHAAGQAAAVAHVAAHELGAAAYAIESARAVVLESGRDKSGRLECQWQREQLPDAIRDLVLDDQRLRDEICWFVFDC